MEKLDKPVEEVDPDDDLETIDAPDDTNIDIRLDQDFSDFAIPPNKSMFKEVDLDIDLTGPLGEEREAVEAPLLEINPLKSFSRRVDLNLGRLHRGGYITPEHATSELSTAFRGIKRPLLNNVLKKGATVVDHPNLIMITSALPNEGKTFTSINLAMSMAMEKDKKILLVDSDISKPSHHEIFGVGRGAGLTEYLTGEVKDVSKVICKTNIPSLSLMFGGEYNQHAIELYASQTMGNFLEELASRYDDRVIIFDAAPLLLPTEATVLASNMGQVVVVVEAERTGQEQLQQAIEMLDNNIVLLVLNKARQKSDLGGYGFYGQRDE